MEYTVVHQGYLCVPYTQIVAKFGAIKQIEDRDGWEIELNELPIEIATFDYEEPEAETAFSIYSYHIASLKLLADLFGANPISNIRPVQTAQLAA